ncbi:MAG TPA: bifunctional UDP-N-acetylglucosamine diphosphorylase/glucosamine-1-phosphate N-acetyltransferase GlmU [Nocardioides sp.]|uniref:bifunctional UDP-N-acetylglucosamine diphosphorylase/glucosamine-1-phosphate N-acetyltransferase GlmU n=1 Tax=uncultured Nocardioides sp. TaxID=198441 RepID=UPI00260D532F|nr:bifunctional UDP-N-acetylglucosamine diphosphorylase/glucosamine-1-phosphate N-acetyltransferase GlmU [uncultured Nocardioides sp.]HRD63522.1 bifunctional UDP-N-acetylglucosamine diphosphorylase/glucosamine-1-phosphate N-acetyltransferase GlmU [Nocardioides sp.]HRI97197.1 bifunctional UDP-N-acetylglucosamine diphosphorylase/glucosamine-1-phosphate N-acetyltransferase GlmU [Nocardioides sp.]HRK46881.1 bifunctional UDP-N-acetylglucosamine diphosphorylase/glucosamine-1-phosphate N-acetyltransfer
MSGELTVIVLAAGGGTRMRSKTMKVLHPVAGRSMVGHVLAAVQEVQPRRIVAVVGHQRDQVGPHIHELVPDALLAVQEEQHGTGHAVRIAIEAVTAQGETPEGTVLVAYGDTPLLEAESLRRFAAEHEAAQRAVSILSGRLDDPHGYGRVIRNGEGEVEAIVEEKDATEEQRAIHEINSGILAFDATFLVDALPRLRNDNAKGEYYLTDTVHLAREAGLHVGAHEIDDVLQTEGVNDRVQLARTGRVMNDRIVTRWMQEGVTVMDPATTWIDADVVLRADVTVLPGVQLLGTTVVDEDAVIGPDTTLKDCEIGAGARVIRTHGELAVIGTGASVGPFAYLRPGTTLGTDGKIGTFVETKNAQLGDGAKVPHLSYVGDAEVGEGTNIGAGTIFANYDGVEKNRTVVGRHAKTGANNTFVAPVTIGDGAGTAGGTVVRRNVPPGALAVSGGPQRNLERWALSKRAGTPQADAAAAALDGVEQSD